MKTIAALTLGVLVIAWLVVQLLAALGPFEYVNWESLTMIPWFAHFIHDWLWFIEGSLLIVGLWLFLRVSRLVGFLAVAIPQLMMWQTLQTTYTHYLLINHGHLFINGVEAPSHVNPSPSLESIDVRK
ncbi:MAG: hypothetical protein ABL974_17080 [Prosthecobacter sp.]